MTRRRILWGVLFLALAGAVWLGVQVNWALTVQPNPAIDYREKGAAMVREAQQGRGEVEGWPALIDAIASMERAKHKFLAQHGSASPEGWSERAAWPPDGTEFRDQAATPAQREALRALLASAGEENLWANLARLRAAQVFNRPLDGTGPLIDLRFPELQSARSLCRWCVADMRRAWSEGDSKRFIERYDQALALAECMARQLTLIDHLVAYAISSLATGELREMLLEEAPDVATLRALSATTRQRLPLSPLKLAIDGERLSGHDMVQRTFSDDGAGDGRYISSAELEFMAAAEGKPRRTTRLERLRNLLWFTSHSRAATVRELDSYYEEAQRLATLTGPNRPPIDLRVVEYRKSGFQMLAVLLPAFGRAFALADEHERDALGTRLMLAVELYHAEHGAWPASLNEALGGVGESAVPVDPVGGKPFVYYVLREGADPDGRGYLLYSTGKDGVDNDGKVRPTAAPGSPAAERDQPGFDVVVNARSPS